MFWHGHLVQGNNLIFLLNMHSKESLNLNIVVIVNTGLYSVNIRVSPDGYHKMISFLKLDESSLYGKTMEFRTNSSGLITTLRPRQRISMLF